MSDVILERDEHPLNAREARKANALQRKLLRVNSPGVWEKLKLSLTDVVCQGCSRSLYGFPTNAATCSAVCRSRHHRKRHGAGSPENSQRQRAGLAHKRLEQRDSTWRHRIPGAHTAGDLYRDEGQAPRLENAPDSLARFGIESKDVGANGAMSISTLEYSRLWLASDGEAHASAAAKVHARRIFGHVEDAHGYGWIERELRQTVEALEQLPDAVRKGTASQQVIQIVARKLLRRYQDSTAPRMPGSLIRLSHSILGKDFDVTQHQLLESLRRIERQNDEILVRLGDNRAIEDTVAQFIESATGCGVQPFTNPRPITGLV